MGMMRRISVLMVLAAVGLPATLHAKPQVMGRWLVSADEDRFGNGGRYFAATPNDAETMAFAIRCLEKNRSIAFNNIAARRDPMKAGDKFQIKLRVDKQPIVEVAGVALDDKLIQAAPDKATLVSIRSGRELAVRIENSSGVSNTHVFRLDGAKKVFPLALKECPID